MTLPPDLLLGAAALAAAVIYYLMASAIPESLLSDAVGPAGLPKVYALLLGGLAVVLIARGLAAWRAGTASPTRLTPGSPARPSPGHGADRRPGAWRPVGLWLIGAGYVVAVPYLGYVPGIAALIIATATYQGRGLDRRTILVGVGGALLLWLLFVQALGIAQPEGLLGGALDVAASERR